MNSTNQIVKMERQELSQEKNRPYTSHVCEGCDG